MSDIMRGLEASVRDMGRSGRAVATSPLFIAYSLILNVQYSVEVLKNGAESLARKVEASKILAKSLRCFRASVNSLSTSTKNIDLPISLILRKCTALASESTPENVQKLLAELNALPTLVQLLTQGMTQLTEFNHELTHFLPEGGVLPESTLARARIDSLARRLALAKAELVSKQMEAGRLNDEIKEKDARITNLERNLRRATDLIPVKSSSVSRPVPAVSRPVPAVSRPVPAGPQMPVVPNPMPLASDIAQQGSARQVAVPRRKTDVNANRVAAIPGQNDNGNRPLPKLGLRGGSPSAAVTKRKSTKRQTSGSDSEMDDEKRDTKRTKVDAPPADKDEAKKEFDAARVTQPTNVLSQIAVDRRSETNVSMEDPAESQDGEDDAEPQTQDQQQDADVQDADAQPDADPQQPTDGAVAQQSDQPPAQAQADQSAQDGQDEEHSNDGDEENDDDPKAYREVRRSSSRKEKRSSKKDDEGN